MVYLLDADSGHPVRATDVESATSYFVLHMRALMYVPSARTESSSVMNNFTRHKFGRVGCLL